MPDDNDGGRAFPPELIPAEQARKEAEARKFDAETKKLDAEARVSNAIAEATEVQGHAANVLTEQDLARAVYKRQVELSSDEFHHVYRFSSAVDSNTAGNCMRQVQAWCRMDDVTRAGDVDAAAMPDPCPIEIEFFSPGGEVTAGLALFDFIQQVRRQDHEVTTSTRGMAASMAGILLQAGDNRVMARESWLLIHQVQAGMMGSWGELQDRAKWLERIQERILDIFAARATPINPKTTKRFLKKNWERTDWWIDSDEALRLGLVDEVR